MAEIPIPSKKKVKCLFKENDGEDDIHLVEDKIG